MYTTGVQACDQLREVAFTGNVIPQNWYRVFVKSDLKHPKPHLLAINILADIVYWYRPREIRDEGTGQVIGYQKKFRDDMLQRSYAQISEQFGCSAGQAKDAIVFLEQMGVVRREFRTLQSNGMVYANVLYLALDVQRLKELTYPSAEISPDGCPDRPDGASDEIDHTPVSEFRGGCAEISTHPPVEFPQTNTEITNTKTTTENSIHLSVSAANDLTDGQTDFSAADVLNELNAEQGIPIAYARNQNRMQTAIRILCDYDHYMSNPVEKTEMKTERRLDSYALMVNSLISMATSTGMQTFCGETVDCYAVIDALNVAMDRKYGYQGALDEMIISALDDYTEALANTHIKNYTGYAKSVLWSSLNSYRVKMGVKYAVI